MSVSSGFHPLSAVVGRVPERVRRLYGPGVSGYALTALPAALVAVLLVVVGRADAAYRVQRGAATRLLGCRLPAPDALSGRTKAARTLAHAVAGLPMAVLNGVLAGVLWGLFLGRGVGYPLASAGESVADSWGGPTMAGAWAAHFGVGLLTLAVLLPLVAVLARVQAATARRFLGTRRAA